MIVGFKFLCFKFSIVVLESGVNMSEPLKEIFTDYYERLCHSIPYDDLMVSLIQGEVLTLEETRNIPVSDTARNTCESAQYLLETHVQKPLSKGDDKPFKKLLSCMKQSRKCAQLAKEIEETMANIDVTDSPRVTKPADTKPKEPSQVRVESSKCVGITDESTPAG